jgi:hypothetical protein
MPSWSIALPGSMSSQYTVETTIDFPLQASASHNAKSRLEMWCHAAQLSWRERLAASAS